MFKDLDTSQLSILAGLLKFERIPAKKVIFREGSVGDKFYSILKGEVKVAVDGIHLVQRGEGECFGEIALLDETPRTATISTRTDCVLLTLTRDAFDSFMKLAPQKLMEMKRIAAERNAATRQITAEANRTMSLKLRVNDGPWPVDVFDRFFLVKGNQLNEDIAQPGKDLVFAKLDSSNPPDIAPFSVKHAVLVHHYPADEDGSTAELTGEAYTAVWWNEDVKFSKPFPGVREVRVK